MDKQQVGAMLVEAMMEANQIAQMNGVRDVPIKTPIIGMIAQNLHESLAALDKGVDVVGNPISPGQIGEGLKAMLAHIQDQDGWAKIQEGLSVNDVNRTVKLTGRIRSLANGLTG